MNSYLNPDTYTTDKPLHTGVLLINLGTPDAPTPKALKVYLREFLSDPRITELPRWFWLPILHGIILNIRPKRSALLYQKIWTEAGSPLLATTQQQAITLQQRFSEQKVTVVYAMRYGNPSITVGLEKLRQANAQRILCLPLYPQYSSSTTGSTFDAVVEVLKKWRWWPELRLITHYYNQPSYINALVEQIQADWAQRQRPEKLLISFHGTPKRFQQAGDPYYVHCQQTAQVMAEQLQLTENQWQLVFQSRFGKEEWLMPYLDKTLEKLGQAGTSRVDVICPGFSADCLETLEEVNETNRNMFLQSGGQEFHYIPALNSSSAHIDMLQKLIQQHICGWQ